MFVVGNFVYRKDEESDFHAGNFMKFQSERELGRGLKSRWLRQAEKTNDASPQLSVIFFAMTGLILLFLIKNTGFAGEQQNHPSR